MLVPKVKYPQSRRMVTLAVRRTTPISPHFVQVTLGGPEVRHLSTSGHDQTARLFFAREGQSGLRMPTASGNAWMAQVLMTPRAQRPSVRTYTVRRVRPEAEEVDIEFVIHGRDAPASRWACEARPGEPAGLFEMGMTYLPPAHAAWHLLVGDESALPAICSILDRAPESLRAEVFLEVPEDADARTLTGLPSGVNVHWLTRNDPAAVPGRLALAHLTAWQPPPGAPYAWIGGEAGLATGVRRHLVRSHGVPKEDIAFYGYWRHGRSSIG